MAGSLVVLLNALTLAFIFQAMCSYSVVYSFDRHKLNNNNEKPAALSDEELKHFNHLGKLGEQGKIIRGEIDELDYFPNGRDFYEHFVRKRVPLIVRGAAKQWPAFEYWKNETYMRSKYGDVLFEVDFTKTYERKPPIKKTITLNKFFDIYKTQEVYLDSAFPQSNLTKYISVPFSLQCEEIMSRISSVHLLYSNGGTSYVLHQDGYENILTVLSGRKVLLIANSSHSSRLHSDEYVTVPGLSPIDPEKVDLVKYPGFAGVSFHEVVLEAGDALYNPQLWWHQVRSYDSPNIGISLWFAQFSVEYNDTTEDIKLEEVAKQAELFEESVQKFPETIACRGQNLPLGKFYWPEGNNGNTPSLEKYKMGIKKLKMHSGYEIPLLGFGTGFLTDEAKISTLTALKSGYRLIDTAVAYNTEEAIAEAIAISKVPRDEIVIVDKVHPKDYYVSGGTIESVEQSLEKLKVDYIDVMLLHATECEEEGGRISCNGMEKTSSRTWEDAWKELEITVDQGKVRSIGVSNFEVSDLERLWEIARHKPSLVQNLFDPFIQDLEVRLFCKEHDIVYMGYSTLGRSWEDVGLTYNPVLNNTVLVDIAASYDASVAQVVLRWAMWENVVVVPRSSNFKHIALNFAAQYTPLNERDVDAIRDLQGQIDEDEVAAAIAKTYSQDQTKAQATAKIIDNPSIVVEREVNVEQDLALYFGSDDYWIYALDGNNGSLLWKHETADETGSVCMTSGSAVYCGADDAYMRAFHANNGSLIWKFRVGGSITSSVRIGESGNLYFGCLDNNIYCVSSSGVLIWETSVGSPVWATPALASEGRLVFIGGLADDPDTGMVYALDDKTGETVWSSLIGGIFASAAVDERRNIVVFCTVQSTCHGMRMDSGEQLWELEVHSEVYSSPSIHRETGVVYVVCLQGTFYALDIETGKTHWKKSVFIPEIRSSPLVLDDGRIFLATGGGIVLHMNSKNGDIIWSKNIDDSEIFSSPKLATNGLLYVGTIRGEMAALNATTGEVVWSYKTDGAVVATVRINSPHVDYMAIKQQFNE